MPAASYAVGCPRCEHEIGLDPEAALRDTRPTFPCPACGSRLALTLLLEPVSDDWGDGAELVGLVAEEVLH